ncbi:MAG: hypothetical protein O7E52_24385 [Candidatus Poribacteria bacterium]|nr:hypothetical protein [Candidatus Poribacteria bacterium]
MWDSWSGTILALHRDYSAVFGIGLKNNLSKEDKAVFARMSLTITISIFLAGLICFFMFGCIDPSENRTSIPLTKLAVVSPSEEMAPRLPSESEPSKSSQPEVQMLMAGEFHCGDISAQSGDIWFGLYPTQDGYELIPAPITVEAIYDPIVDGEGEMTGKKVSVVGTTEPLFLVKGLKTLKRGPVKTLLPGSAGLAPGKSANFTFDNRVRYHLAAFGEKDNSSGFKNYELELFQGESSQIILSYRSTNDAVPYLLWAGDLDRDGQLDLLIDATNHYALSAPTLFLSSAAQDNRLLAQVAALMTFC